MAKEMELSFTFFKQSYGYLKWVGRINPKILKLGIIFKNPRLLIFEPKNVAQ